MFADCPAEPLTTSGTERCHSGRHAAPVSVPTGFYCVPHKDRKRVLLAVLSFVRALGFPLLLPPPLFHFPTPLSNVKLVCVQLLYRPTSLPMPNWCVCLVVVPSLSPFSQCQTGVCLVVPSLSPFSQCQAGVYLVVPSSLLSQCQTGVSLVVVPSLSPFSQCQTGVCLVAVPSNLSPNVKLVCPVFVPSNFSPSVKLVSVQLLYRTPFHPNVKLVCV